MTRITIFGADIEVIPFWSRWRRLCTMRCEFSRNQRYVRRSNNDRFFGIFLRHFLVSQVYHGLWTYDQYSCEISFKSVNDKMSLIERELWIAFSFLRPLHYDDVSAMSNPEVPTIKEIEDLVSSNGKFKCFMFTKWFNDCYKVNLSANYICFWLHLAIRSQFISYEAPSPADVLYWHPMPDEFQ